jgi:hypothetical protein
MSKVTPEDRTKILDLFLAGNTLNLIVALLGYKFNDEDVNHVIRDRLKDVTAMWLLERGALR